MNLFSLLNSLSSDNPIHAVSIPTTWHQGRTAYGGLSTTLAYQAAALAAPDLPPLLSAQIAFAGPVAGDVTIEAKVLRRGRNSAFIRSDIRSGEDIVFSGTFVFMAPRESHVNFSDIAAPDFPSIPDDEGLRSGPPEFFTYHMQYAEKRLIEGNGTSSLSGWYRFREHQGLDPTASLLCIGDALPPSAMGLMTEQGMVSSINWQVNLLSEKPQTDNGWWYLQSETHFAAHGASSQTMHVWNSRGEPMMTGMQAVAIFA
ncbi:MAG: thioesterase family protein [Sphingomonadales bacterium]|nr:thioesterase family protein [Sphingomonadales bacterium]